MTLGKSNPVTLSPDEAARLLRAAEVAADRAAEVTLRYFRADLTVENKLGQAGFDPVTEADRQAERVIRDYLLEVYPDIGFFGEEHASVSGSSALTWVVDPIDGTRAYMSGMPLWGTLIGLFDGQRAVLGLMDQPWMQERFVSAAGQSWLYSRGRREALKTRQGVALSQATLYCTTPDMFSTPDTRAAFESVRDACQLTRYGGDCYAYALLAAGYADVVLDCDLKPYDIVALIPLIECAGGVVSNWQGQGAEDGGLVVAAGSADLHAQTLALLQAGA